MSKLNSSPVLVKNTKGACRSPTAPEKTLHVRREYLAV